MRNLKRLKQLGVTLLSIAMLVTSVPAMATEVQEDASAVEYVQEETPSEETQPEGTQLEETQSEETQPEEERTVADENQETTEQKNSGEDDLDIEVKEECVTVDSSEENTADEIVITSQPSGEILVHSGESITVNISAYSSTGSTLTYLWRYCPSDGDWTDTDCTSESYTFTADMSMDGMGFYCVITDESGNSVTSHYCWLRVYDQTEGSCGDNVTWVYDDSEGTLTISGTGDMYDYGYNTPWYVLASKIKKVYIDYGVTSIGSYAFESFQNVESISIPESVTRIGVRAFNCCYLLSNITIPNGVTTIEDQAFGYTYELKSITIPDSVTSIGSGAFWFSGLTNIIIPDSVTSIGMYAFFACRMSTISLPGNITSIEEGTFQECSLLKTIIIPASVTSIGDGAFGGCRNLTDIYIYNDQIVLSENSLNLYLTDAEKEQRQGQVLRLHGYDNIREYVESLNDSNVVFVSLNAASITTQPVDESVVAGNTFKFMVAAEGEGLTYLWQYSKDGGITWIDTTRTKDNYTTTATTSMNGRMYRCVVTNASGESITSDPATLTVKPAISITAQPSSATVNVGEKYSFKVTAKSNTGSKLTYLWQYSKTLKGWTDTTRTLNNYGTNATLGVDGKYFRCKITDEAGNVVYSEPAMVRVLSDITITEQPTDTTVATGKRYYFTVAATGASLTYKWEYSKDGGNTWIATTRAKNNYTTYAKKAMNGWMFRCVITDSSNNSVTTESGTLTVN